MIVGNRFLLAIRYINIKYKVLIFFFIFKNIVIIEPKILVLVKP